VDAGHAGIGGDPKPLQFSVPAVIAGGRAPERQVFDPRLLTVRSREWKEAPWARFCTAAPPRQRRRAIQHSQMQNGQESLRACQALRHQPQDRGEVAGSPTCRPDRRAEIHGSVGLGRGDHRGLPQAHAAAAGRLPLCPAGNHPAPDPLVTASLPAAPRPRSTAACRG
jgi:hypothetical protein